MCLLKLHLHSQADVYTDSCGHHGQVVALFILPSGVHLEDAFHACAVDRCLQEHSVVTAPWMYNKSWIGLRCSALQYCSEKSPCGPKSIFPIDHHCKRDVCKTVDRTPRTANNVNYDSFYYELLIHGGFIFVKLSSSWEKRFKNLWCHHNVKSVGWAGTCGRGQRGKHYCAYSVGCTTRKQTWKLETFFGVCASRAVFKGLNGRHFRSGTQLL